MGAPKEVFPLRDSVSSHCASALIEPVVFSALGPRLSTFAVPATRQLWDPKARIVAGEFCLASPPAPFAFALLFELLADRRRPFLLLLLLPGLDRHGKLGISPLSLLLRQPLARAALAAGSLRSEFAGFGPTLPRAV